MTAQFLSSKSWVVIIAIVSKFYMALNYRYIIYMYVCDQQHFSLQINFLMQGAIDWFISTLWVFIFKC